MESKYKFDLEDRLIQFSLVILSIVELLPDTKIGNHIGGQLLRCGTSPAFNYGEAQSAESDRDYVHKMKICLKELRETKIPLKIIMLKPLVKDTGLIKSAFNECDELVAIFYTSIKTSLSKNKKNKE